MPLPTELKQTNGKWFKQGFTEHVLHIQTVLDLVERREEENEKKKWFYMEIIVWGALSTLYNLPIILCGSYYYV